MTIVLIYTLGVQLEHGLVIALSHNMPKRSHRKLLKFCDSQMAPNMIHISTYDIISYLEMLIVFHVLQFQSQYPQQLPGRRVK